MPDFCLLIVGGLVPLDRAVSVPCCYQQKNKNECHMISSSSVMIGFDCNFGFSEPLCSQSSISPVPLMSTFTGSGQKSAKYAHQKGKLHGGRTKAPGHKHGRGLTGLLNFGMPINHKNQLPHPHSRSSHRCSSSMLPPGQNSCRRRRMCRWKNRYFCAC